MMLGLGYHLQATYGLEHSTRQKSAALALELLQKCDIYLILISTHTFAQTNNN